MPPQKLLDQSKRAKNFISSKGTNVTARQFIQYWTIILPIKSNINIDYPSTTIPQIHKWLIVGVRLSPLLHRHHPPWWLHSSQRGKVRAAHDHHDHHGHNGRDHDHNGRDHDYNHNGKGCTSIEEWWNPKILSDLFSPPSWQLKAFVLFSGLSNIAF